MALVGMRRKLPQLLWVVWIFVAIFILGIAFTGLNTGPLNRAPVDGEHVLAKIGAREVSNTDLQRLLAGFEAFAGRSSVTQQAEYPGIAWNQLLDDYARAEAARALGIQVSEDEARQEINRQIEQQLAVIGKGSSREELSEYRAAMRANADVEGMRRQLLAQRLQAHLEREARPVEVKVAHILVKTEGRSDAEARRKAQELARQARAGADFAKLARQHSEDPGSKEKGGEVGWASAQPPASPPMKDGKPDPNAATRFVPEFTAAALRLRPGEVSDPVRSTFGYHVIKALEERPYQPADAAAQKDPKKRQEAIEQYRSSVAMAIADGLVREARERLEGQIEPRSDWLQGYFLERQLPPAPFSTKKEAPKAAADAAERTKAEQEASRIGAVVAAYEKALKENELGPGAAPGLAYKAAQLRLRAADAWIRAGKEAQAKSEREQALALLERWARRSGDPEMYVLQGETLEKLGRKTEAVGVYETAIRRTADNTIVLGEIAGKLRALGRADLAKKAIEKQSQILARREAEAKAQDAAARAQGDAGSPAPAPAR